MTERKKDKRFGGQVYDYGKRIENDSENGTEKIPYPLKAALSYLHSVGAHRNKKVTLLGIIRRLDTEYHIKANEQDLTVQLSLGADRGLVEITENNGRRYYRLNASGEDALSNKGLYQFFDVQRGVLGEMYKNRKIPKHSGET